MSNHHRPDGNEPNAKRPRTGGALKAVILVGGPSKGTRFRPLSLDIPKALFPIAGQPLISHHLRACAKLPNLKEVILLGFYDKDHAQWKEFVQQQQKELHINIKFLKEEQVMGTAGGLAHFEREILEGEPSAFFVLHCDVLSPFPLHDLLSAHNSHPNALCTILGKRVPTDQAHKYGCLAVEPKTHELMHYAEKPETFVSDLINAGVYVFSPQIFEMMKTLQSDNRKHSHQMELDEPLDRLSLERDVLPAISGEGRAFVHEVQGFWLQVKAPGMLIKCTENLLNEIRKDSPQLLAKSSNIVGNVLIHPAAKVDPTAKIGPNVSIGEGVNVGAGARIANSIILNNVEVADRACILHSIVGWNSKIGKWARLEGTPDMEKASSEAQNFGITILGGAVTVSSEVVVRACVVLPNKEIGASCSNQIIL